MVHGGANNGMDGRGLCRPPWESKKGLFAKEIGHACIYLNDTPGEKPKASTFWVSGLFWVGGELTEFNTARSSAIGAIFVAF